MGTVAADLTNGYRTGLAPLKGIFLVPPDGIEVTIVNITPRAARGNLLDARRREARRGNDPFNQWKH